MARSNSPRAHLRRHVLDVLAAVRRETSVMQAWWTTTSRTYDLNERDGHGNVIWRDRRPEEYPEASVQTWRDTIVSLDDMITGLTILRDQAIDTYQEMGGSAALTATI